MRAFVIAMACEAAQLPEKCAGELMIVSGIGKVNAAMAAQKAIDLGAEEIINFGLAGGFGDFEVGDLAEVEKAVEYDFDIDQLNHRGVGVLDEMDTPYLPLETTGKFRKVTLMTGDRFNDSDADLELMQKLGGTVRDMEGAAITHVCLANKVKCRALKCISDVHGKGSMTRQFEDNRERALKCLKDALICWI